nr:vegetative cell wall protein gp1-like [Aegilops tauschii subsp. strangulata]
MRLFVPRFGSRGLAVGGRSLPGQSPASRLCLCLAGESEEEDDDQSSWPGGPSVALVPTAPSATARSRARAPIPFDRTHPQLPLPSPLSPPTVPVAPLPAVPAAAIVPAPTVFLARAPHPAAQPRIAITAHCCCPRSLLLRIAMALATTSCPSLVAVPVFPAVYRRSTPSAALTGAKPTAGSLSQSLLALPAVAAELQPAPGPASFPALLLLCCRHRGAARARLLPAPVASLLPLCCLPLHAPAAPSHPPLPLRLCAAPPRPWPPAPSRRLLPAPAFAAAPSLGGLPVAQADGGPQESDATPADYDYYPEGGYYYVDPADD